MSVLVPTWLRRRDVEALAAFAALLCIHALLVALEWWPPVAGGWDLLHTAAFLYIPLAPILLDTGDLSDFAISLGDVRRTLTSVALAVVTVLIPFLGVWALATAWAQGASGAAGAAGIGGAAGAVPGVAPGAGGPVLPSASLPAGWPHWPIDSLIRLLAEHPMHWAPDRDLASLAWYHLVAVALPEEFFFRTYMQTRLDQAWGTPWRLWGAPVGWGLLASSAAFALTHPAFGRPWISLDVFLPSLVFGWLRARTGSLAAPVAFHWLCNVTVLNLGG